MYRNVRLWNHPPLMGYLVLGLRELAQLLDLRFAPTFKLVPIVAEVFTGLLVFALRRKTDGYQRAIASLIVYSLSLDAILVSGYHGNLDPIVGGLVLATCAAMERGRYVLAGAIFAVAVNIKLIPLLVLPVLVASVKPRDILRFCAGAAPGSLPFLVVLASVGDAFINNAVRYRSNFDNWGIPLAIRAPWYFAQTRHLDSLKILLEKVGRAYIELGTVLVVGAIVALAVHFHRTRAFSLYERAALGLSAFLVLAPGFGVQYTAILGPVLLAASFTWGRRWAWVAGLFLLVVYATFWTGGYPLHSYFYGSFRIPGAAVGITAWGLLIAYLFQTLRRRPA
jgi:hypothetical protein